ncbi:proliferation marker protein Ki-67-like isoform X2 [Notechis scutatus]|uniref:Proliferation marker protein Ki-67-like isoform X2 n=1 Tax=Notechis scutatus TaxID=8663 RepID=A0A6J1U6L7_9SAUR|nr:proliferation marker protein Ki-67-like isoform X2 [Notechis scutatus]
MQETSPASNSSRGKIYKLKMPFFGQIVVVKRNGTDGNHFPLTASSCLFGREKKCDIRIQLPQVSKEHCKIEVNENKEAVLFNLSSANPTQLNGNHFQDPTHLKHGDILTIIDRSFRFEYPPPPLPQKRLSRSQEKETQILHVQHMQQMDLLHPQNSDYKSSPITGKKCETCSPRRNEKKLQKQYSDPPEFKYKMHSIEKANELSPFSKLYELMKHEDGTGNVKENTGNETLMEDVFRSRSRRSAVNRAKLTKVEQSEDSKIQRKHGGVASPIPTFEKKKSKKSSTQNCDMQQKQECEGANQSDFKNIEENELEKCAHFKANQQSAQHFPESCILSLDYTEKAKCLNKFNITDAFTSIENTLPKVKPSQESTQNYSSPCSRKPRRSSRSRRTGVERDSLNKMKSSEEMKECPVQVSGQEPESGILIENISSKTNENRELVTEAVLNLKDSEDGNSSTVFSSLHLNTSENCNNIELNKIISNEYSCTEAIDKESIIPADLSQTSEIMANEIPEKNLETKCPTNENKIGTENHEQNVNMKNDISTFSSSYESRVQTSAKVNAVSEMNVLCPLNKKSEAKKSPQRRRGTELDFLVQSLGKRKRVSFGGQLSPELFDKRLPPNSPLKKGAIPARLSMPFGNSPRAVLKKAAELSQSVIQGSFERKQYEKIVSRQADSHSAPQRQQCISDPHVANQPSESEETTTQEMHMNSLFSEVKKTVSSPTSSLRSKPCTPRRSSTRGKSGVMGTIHSKRRSGASEANLMVAKSWAEVVKQGIPKLQLKSASKQGFKTRSMKKVASKSSKKNSSLKTPKRKISGHFTTGHANSPAPIVIGKAHSGILNITAQVPKVVINYPLKKHCDLNESFTGLAEMFCSPPDGKQKSFIPETQISEINPSEVSEKKSVLDVNISSQRAHNQDIISPALEEVSQIPIHDNLVVSLNERNIMGMEEEKLQQESEPVRQLLEIKRLLKTTKERSEPAEVLSGVKRLLRTPKEKSESVEALSGVKRLLRTPKQKPDPVEALSGIKRLFKSPKKKSEPVEDLSGIKRLFKTPKEKSESVQALSGDKRLLRTPKQKSEPVEALSGVKSLLRTPKEKSESVQVLSGDKRLLRTPKQKSEPVEALSGVKSLLRTPKEKSESVEVLSGVKRLLRTPKQKPDPVEVLSGIKRLLETPEQKSEPVEVFSGIKVLKTPKQTMEPPADDIYTTSRLSTEEVLKDMIGSVTKNEAQIMEDTTINGITEEVKETVKPIEDRGNTQMMSPKQRFEPINNMVDSSQTLKASKPKSMPTDDYLRLQKFIIEPKESFIIPDIDYTGVKEMLDTENDKAKMPESLNFVEENGSYTSSRNKLESMENVPGSCEADLEKESRFPITKNNSSVPNHEGYVACNLFNELKTEFNKKTTRTISLSENYEPDGMSFKNEVNADFVKEATENSDALKTEKPEPLALGRTRRRKINDCSSAVYTKTIERPTKNRSTSANCEQISENFDSHTELKLLHKSESNFTIIETTKLSKRGRPKKQNVETNGNIGSNNISHTQKLEKPLKETAVEKHPVNRRKVATKRKGKMVTSMDLEENGPIQENENDLTAKTRLRSRNVKKSASDIKTTIAKGKANDTMSGEESNKRRKIAAIQSSPETLITTLNADEQGTQKSTMSKICKTEASENNLKAVGKKLVEKKKKVQFLLNDDFKASEEKCVLGYESNTHKEESQTENICNGIPKVPLESMQTPAEPSPPRIEKNLPSRGRGKKSVSNPSVESESKPASDGKDHDVIVSLKENQPRRGRGRRIDQVVLKSVPLENNISGDSTVNKCPSSQGGCSLPQAQNENFEESEMLPLENVQTCEGHIPPKRIVKENPPRRGRSKQVNETSGNEADVQGPNIGQEDNQSKKARGKRNTQESCSLKSQRTVKENPPKRGRHKKSISDVISTDSNSTHINPIIGENKNDKDAFLAKEDQSKVSRRTRNTLIFQKILSPVKNDTCHLLSSNRGEHSDEQPNEDLKTANNANENFTYKCRKRKAVHEISANSISSNNDIQQNGKKDSKAVSKQNTSRSKRKQLAPCGMSAESNDELRISSRKSPLVTDNLGPLENSFEKKHQLKQRQETNIASLVPPSLNMSITLSSNENQSGNCKESVGKGKLAKLSGTYNIITRSLRGKRIILKEEFVHEIQNKDLQKTAKATLINQRRGRRKINKLEATVSPSPKEKCTLSAGSNNFPNEQILNNVSNKKVSLMGKAPKFLEIKTMTQNINQNDSSNYDQNKNVKHSNMLVQKGSSEHAKRKQINNSETIITANMVKNVTPESKSTVSKTVQTRGKKKMKEENTTLMTELPKETEGRTRASKRIRK